MRRWAALLLAAWLGCAPARPMAYQRAIAEANRAYTAGRMREAAEAFERAAALTTRPRDQQESRYLAAESLWRAGELRSALERMHSIGADPDAERAARASLEAARIEVELGEHDAAARTLEALALAHPATGPARRAVTLLVEALDRRDPSGALALEHLATLAARTPADTMLDGVLDATARRLQAAGRTDEAIVVWRRMLAEVPYPTNRHWDDGTLSLARALSDAHDPRGAIAVIERSLSVRERSYSNGSYEAPHFADCAMLRANLLRDPVGDLRAAAAAFHAIYTDYPVSRLRDDALREEAVTRQQQGDHEGACGVWERLAREFACTRRGREALREAVACGRVLPAGLDGPCRHALTSNEARRATPPE